MDLTCKIIHQMFGENLDLKNRTLFIVDDVLELGEFDQTTTYFSCKGKFYQQVQIDNQIVNQQVIYVMLWTSVTGSLHKHYHSHTEIWTRLLTYFGILLRTLNLYTHRSLFMLLMNTVNAFNFYIMTHFGSCLPSSVASFLFLLFRLLCCPLWILTIHLGKQCYVKLWIVYRMSYSM